MNESVYLDYNSTTPIKPEVVDAMMPYLQDLWANPSSAHTFGNKIRRSIDRAREQVADLIGANEPSEIIFTSGATESNNMVIRSVLSDLKGSKKLVTTKTEHAAIIGPAQYIENNGASVHWLSVDKNGLPDLKEYDELVNQPLSLISIIWANNETGVINPIPTLSKVAADKGIIFHTDAVQMVGKCKIDLKNLSVNMLSLSGHKVYGPKGIGALYVRKGTRIPAQILGGHQERARRAGTENVPAIIGFGKACELANKSIETNYSRITKLRQKLETGVLSTCKGSFLNGSEVDRLPNTSNISFEKLDGEAILFMLDDHDIHVSTGSACESGSLEASHVLKAMNVESNHVHGAIRFSLGEQTTEKDIDKLIEVLPPIINRCRELAPNI